jgi:hypothetical protein
VYLLLVRATDGTFVCQRNNASNVRLKVQYLSVSPFVVDRLSNDAVPNFFCCSHGCPNAAQVVTICCISGSPFIAFPFYQIQELKGDLDKERHR